MPVYDAHGQAVDCHTEYAVESVGGDVSEQTLHFRTVLNSIAGSNFLIDFYDREVHAPGQIEQG